MSRQSIASITPSDAMALALPRADVLHRLMVRAVHSESVSPHDAMEQAVGRYLHGMGQTRSGKWRSMRQRCGHLRGNILDKGASQRYIDRLHPAADTQHRQSLTCGKMGYIQFEFIASPARQPRIRIAGVPRTDVAEDRGRFPLTAVLAALAIRGAVRPDRMPMEGSTARHRDLLSLEYTGRGEK